MTSSCSAALDIACLLAGLKPDHEVIVPSFTFVSTANAVVRLGARPVFVDIRSDTLNLDERLVEAAITERTRAIIAVHYGGVGCEMDELRRIAQRHSLTLIEDAASSLNAFYIGSERLACSATWAVSVFMKPRICIAAKEAHCA